MIERVSRAGANHEADHVRALMRLARSWHLAGPGYGPSISRGANPYYVGTTSRDGEILIENLIAYMETLERLIDGL